MKIPIENVIYFAIEILSQYKHVNSPVEAIDNKEDNTQLYIPSGKAITQHISSVSATIVFSSVQHACVQLLFLKPLTIRKNMLQ